MRPARHFCGFFAELRRPGAATGAGARTVAARLVRHVLARRVFRQRLAPRLRALRVRRRASVGLRLGDLLGIACHRLFELELLDAPGNPLRGPAELRAAQPGELELEFLNRKAAELDRERGRLEFRLARQRKGR
jgi:hypothetical protein